MATVKLWTDEEVASVPAVKAAFDEIRATRKSDFVNNFWRALANQRGLLERTWASVRQVMIEPGVLNPLEANRPKAPAEAGAFGVDHGAIAYNCISASCVFTD